MITCREAGETLAALIFGELADPDGRAEAFLNEHLLGCAACREEEARLLSWKRGLSDPATVPASLEARLRAAWNREAPEARLREEARRRGRWASAARESLLSATDEGGPAAGRRSVSHGWRGLIGSWLRRPVPAYAAILLAAILLLLGRGLPAMEQRVRSLRPAGLEEETGPGRPQESDTLHEATWPKFESAGAEGTAPGIIAAAARRPRALRGGAPRFGDSL